jgi:hypothetical protein
MYLRAKSIYNYISRTLLWAKSIYKYISRTKNTPTIKEKSCVKLIDRGEWKNDLNTNTKLRLVARLWASTGSSHRPTICLLGTEMRPQSVGHAEDASWRLQLEKSCPSYRLRFERSVAVYCPAAFRHFTSLHRHLHPSRCSRLDLHERETEGRNLQVKVSRWEAMTITKNFYKSIANHKVIQRLHAHR